MQDSRRHLQNDFKIHSQQAALVRDAHQHAKALRGRACAAYHHPSGECRERAGLHPPHIYPGGSILQGGMTHDIERPERVPLRRRGASK